MDTFSPHRLGTVVTKMLTQLYTYDNGSSTISRGATAMLLFLWHVAVREGGGNYADMDLRYQALVDTLNHITAEEANLLWLTPYGCSLVVADPAQPPRAKICDYCSCLLPDKPGCSRAVACGTCAVACYCSVGCMEQDKLSHGRMCLRLQRLKHTTQWWRLSRHDHIDQEFGSHIKAWYHDATVSQADTGSGID
eukprot:jgi/Chrzof1/5457/Cz16g04030.t1